MTDTSIEIAALPVESDDELASRTCDEVDSLPWRNNLAALSQTVNLLFRAVSQSIYISQPQFPSQRLPADSAIALDVPTCAPHRPGYIEYRLPRAPNRIMTHYLGVEEILLMTCDNGDVIAFWIVEIHAAFLRSLGDWEDDPSDDLGMQPFLHENLGKSAWGIDVHSKERLIAASCNTHRVTIFAFAIATAGDYQALRDSESESGQRSASPRRPWHSAEDLEPEGEKFQGRAPLSDRWFSCGHDTWSAGPRSYDMAFEIELRDNIPNLSFANQDDAGMDFLVLNTVGKGIHIIDWRNRSLLSDYCLDQLGWGHLGWGALCLDPKNCLRANDAQSTYGSAVLLIEESLITSKTSYEKNWECSLFGDTFPREPIGPEAQHTDSSEYDHEMDDEDESLDSWEAEELELHRPNDPAAYRRPTDHEDESSDSSEADDLELDDEISDGSQGAPESSAYASNHPHQKYTDNETDYEWKFSEKLPRYTRRDGRMLSLMTHVVPERRPNKCDAPLTPLVFVSTNKTSIAINHIKIDTQALQRSGRKASIVYENPFNLPAEDSIITGSHLHQLNMTHQIAELGILLVAEPLLGVLVFTMTYWAEKNRYGLVKNAELAAQKLDADHDPGRRLISGMAVSPIQGQLDGEWKDAHVSAPPGKSSRRFRIILTYIDGSIRCYEIWRPSSTPEDLLII